MKTSSGLSRREFFTKSTLGLIGGGFLGPISYTGEKSAEEDKLKIKEYRILGRTGFRVSDIGAGDFDDPAPFRGLLDAGVNYIDTSETYGQHGRKIAEVIKGRDRSSLFISSKLQADTSIRHIATAGIHKEGFLKRFYRVLDTLQTDYLDCLMISSPETVDDLFCKGFHEAAEQLKKDGKIRFVGVSHHGSQWFYRKPRMSMEDILLAAAEDGRFDVMLMAYNFLKEDRSEQILEVCDKKNIGTTLMKTTPIRSYNFMKEYYERKKARGKELSSEELKNIARMEKKMEKAQDFIKRYDLKSEQEIRDAAIKFVLSNPFVHTVCTTVLNFNDMRNFLKLSGSRLERRDKKLLSVYAQDCGEFYCRHACGICEPACPHEVPVNTIMRYDHYFSAQGREKHAMTQYAHLGSHSAENCTSCEGYCEKACPYGVPVQTLLSAAHQTLTFS
ncbi:MAG: aldo/keto reductase [Candidatus Aminicenantes bacterium]|nr:aldo/keto reductase [Candidatus Aminicenantes bacterium]